MFVERPSASFSRTPIAISTLIDGVALSGAITYLAPNDMLVVIHAPMSGLGTGLHVPYFAMQPVNWLATYETVDGTRVPVLTARGRERAADLLRELYDHSRGTPSGWGVSRVEPDGRWVDI